MKNGARLAIPFRSLLAVYSIVPVFAAVIIFDLLLLGGQLRAAMPVRPETIFLYALLFNVPHHLASLFSLADREYLGFYRKKLLLGLPLLLAAFLALHIYAPPAAFLAFILYTEYHVMSQQSGIARFYIRQKLPAYAVWKWTGIVLLALAYARTLTAGELGAYADLLMAWQLSAALAVFFLFLSIRLFAAIDSRKGRLFLFAVAASILAGYGFLYAG
ncbi:MAG TPA: hypothetical protein VFY28_01970, partial [Candidatus Paceibacterota bacterium]|nr:hypothetical protein [Candidatus Paceibacterota bacterium]